MKHTIALQMEIDGAINPPIAELRREAGAAVSVTGTSIFHAGDYAAEGVNLRLP